jgi:protein-S-isoprenylcysteine O-methyltransferase Ste14
MNDRSKKISPFVVALNVFLIAVVLFLPLLISRHWDWWEAWVYGAVGILGFAVSRLLVARRYPDLIAERVHFMRHENAKAWDKVLSLLLMLGGALILLVAGLDRLFGWSSTFSLQVRILSLVIMLAGYILESYALFENRFFSGVVRIQTDRGHQVVSSGPYRWMRHPGYAGGLLANLVTPPFLSSEYAFLPVVIVVVLTVIRTDLEDRTLRNELEGYADYARRVRYRLLPGVW